MGLENYNYKLEMETGKEKYITFCNTMAAGTRHENSQPDKEILNIVINLYPEPVVSYGKTGHNREYPVTHAGVKYWVTESDWKLLVKGVSEKSLKYFQYNIVPPPA